MIYNMSHVIGRAHSKQVSVPIHVCVFGIYGPVNKELSAEITHFFRKHRCGCGKQYWVCARSRQYWMLLNRYVALPTVFVFLLLLLGNDSGK